MSDNCSCVTSESRFCGIVLCDCAPAGAAHMKVESAKVASPNRVVDKPVRFIVKVRCLPANLFGTRRWCTREATVACSTIDAVSTVWIGLGEIP